LTVDRRHLTAHRGQNTPFNCHQAPVNGQSPPFNRQEAPVNGQNTPFNEAGGGRAACLRRSGTPTA